jgi:membrane-associated phospholipid phosphatase
MHFVSDMVASFVLGPLVLVITLRLLRRSLTAKQAEADDTWPQRARVLDRT